MPRSLRWLTAVSTAIVAFFVFSALTLGVAKAAGTDELRGGAALLVSLGGTILPLLAALAVNDWLRERYGLPAKRGSDERVSSPRA